MPSPKPTLKRLFAQVRAAGGRILDLVYPPSCLVCREAVGSQGGLCPVCWNAMGFIERPFCERLGIPFDREEGARDGMISVEAAAHPPVFLRARAVARYAGAAEILVARLKYHDRLELAEPMGRWMARAGAELLADAALIVPTPLHRLRLAQRGYNQAAELARVISKECATPMDALAVERVKHAPSQVGLSRSQRVANLAGAFRVEPQAAARIAGLNIVLVDDVLTTGATANAAARALLKAGAARVDALVFARAVTAP